MNIEKTPEFITKKRIILSPIPITLFKNLNEDAEKFYETVTILS